MNVEASANAAQAELWNGIGGRNWVEEQGMLDRLLQPAEDLLSDEVSRLGPRSLLDVGCGTGTTTLAASFLLGPTSRCVGIDISEPMLAFARERAESAGLPVSFVQGDAQTYAFEPASFDMIISRFGVMFFEDPVRAFANLHSATAPGGQLRVVTWREPEANPFMIAAEEAVAPLMRDLPVRRAGEPGQFGLADRDAFRGILEQGDWSAIELRPFDFSCSLPVAKLDTYLSKQGPVGRALEGADADTREKVLGAVRPVFERYISGDEVRFTAACWLASASA